MIGAEFASRLSGRPDVPVFESDDRCPVCAAAGGRCPGPGVAQLDMASRIQEFAVARGQQQTRRAPGRPLADPEAEEARQKAWLAKQAADADVESAPETVEPVVEGAPEVAGPPPVDPAAQAAVAAITEPAAETLSPLDAGVVLDPDAPSPRLTDGPTLVRGAQPGVYRSQGVDAGVAKAPVPEGDPAEVRDVYVVPDGVIAPEDDPARPDPADAVLVGDAAQLVATGAWASLPGGTSIVTTRKVLRVWWPMGTLSPCYSTVADRGVVLPRPAAAR